jgi:hypothetical protein
LAQYVPNQWRNLESGGTPITADRLNLIENGVGASAVVSDVDDPATPTGAAVAQVVNLAATGQASGLGGPTRIWAPQLNLPTTGMLNGDQVYVLSESKWYFRENGAWLAEGATYTPPTQPSTTTLALTNSVPILTTPTAGSPSASVQINFKTTAGTDALVTTGVRISCNGTTVSGQAVPSQNQAVINGSATFTQLRPGTAYIFTGQLLNGSTLVGTAVTLTVTMPTSAPAPGSVTTLSLTAVAGNGSVTVTNKVTPGTDNLAVSGVLLSRNGTDTTGVGAWSTTVPANSSFTFGQLKPGVTYTFSADMENASGTPYGNPVSIQATPTGSVASGPASVTDSAFTYTGAWTLAIADDGTTQHYDNVTNDTATITFTVGAGGGTVSLVGNTGAANGYAAIKIDSGSETNVNFYAAAETDQLVMWTSSSLSAGTHTLHVRVTGTIGTTGGDAFVSVQGAKLSNGSFGTGVSTVTASAVVNSSSSVTMSWSTALGTDSASLTGVVITRSGTDASGGGPVTLNETSLSGSFTFTNLVAGASYTFTADPLINGTPAGRTSSQTVVTGTAGGGTPTAPVGPSGTWRLVFDDEFNGTSLDLTRWTPLDGGNMNNVTTHASNVSVSGGNLILTLASSSSGAEVDSAPYDGAGSNGYTMPVGDYVEARIYFPGNGSTVYNWPAFWTSGPSWPAAGEVDIFEGLGTATTNYHSPSGQDGPFNISGTWVNAFHTYGMHRKSTSVDIYWDGTLVKTMATSDNGAAQAVLINVGSGNTGVYGAASQVLVDWVRAWTPSTGTPAPTGTALSKVLVIVEENHSLSEMESSMPYLFGLAQQYSYASNYSGLTHPSLPNYLAIAAGSFFGISDDNPPSSHPLSGSTVFGQAISKGKTAKTYCESMPSNNYQSDSGNYAVKHNPWAYFTSEVSWANQFDISASSFTSDASNNRLPTVSMLVPNLIDDAHDGTLTDADNYLQSVLPSVLNSSDFTSGALAVVVTADEDDGTQSNKVLTTVLHASLNGSHKVVSTALNHYSLSRLLSQLSGSTPLNNATSAADLAAAFGLTIG